MRSGTDLPPSALGETLAETMSDESDSGHNSRWDAAEEAMELLREGEHDAAILEAERLIETDARNEYGYFVLGCAQFEKGDFSRALAAFTKALELAPQYNGALLHAAHTLRMMGKYKEALRAGVELLRRKENDPDAHYMLGMTYVAMGERRLARTHLEAFLETKPELEAALEVQGTLSVLGGDVVEMDESRRQMN